MYTYYHIGPVRPHAVPEPVGRGAPRALRSGRRGLRAAVCYTHRSHVYIYIYIYMADSQIVYTEMVAERKTEESIPYGSKNHRGYTEKNKPPCAHIA